MLAGRESGVIVLDAPSRARIAELRGRIHRVRRAAARDRQQVRRAPFLLVTPLGLEEQGTLRMLLRAAGVAVRDRTALYDRLLALSVPCVAETTDARLARALAYDALWERALPGRTAERWDLASDEDYTRLLHHKDEIRQRLPRITARVRAESLEMTANLRAFHLPDPDCVAREAALVGGLV